MLKYYVKSLVVLLCITVGASASCVTYDFEADFYSTFNNESILCTGLPLWNTGTYGSKEIPRPSSESEGFVAPNQFLSCISSFEFEMEATGAVEVYAYIDSVSQRDQLAVLVHASLDDAADSNVGTTMLTPLTTNFFNGWHILRIPLFGTGSYKGYVSFLGSAADGSKLIVDSFRYIPPSFDDADCEIYEEVLIRPPEVIPEVGGDCVAQTFEKEFDITFSSDRGFCNGLSPWTLNNYSTVSIESPSLYSEQFITPGNTVSCVSSLPFLFESGGTVQVIIYMDSASEHDQIGVLTNRVAEDGNDAVIGTAVFTPLTQNYFDGWHILTIAIAGEGTYEGYISFLGIASEESNILIDSFRYIPPTLSQKECLIYEDEDFGSNPIIDGSKCVTYNFESDYETSFVTTNSLCIGYSAWRLGSYYSLPINSYDPSSSTFIAPNETSSCVSSFTFDMRPGGTVEVNVFMESVSSLDYIIVLAMKVVSNGIDTVAGFQLYYATNENFVVGWNILKVIVNDFKPFKGYITLIGSTEENSIGLIDSFRYIPPGSEDQCEIY